MKQKNYIIEFLRFFFTIGVVVGHAFCVFYQENNPSYTINFHNACVDFFFVLSGFFMANHFCNNKNLNSVEMYLKYNVSRIKRFFPLLVVAALEGILYDALHGSFFSGRWGTFFFLGGINNFFVWNVVWYISALFWCGIIASSLLCFKKKISVLVYFPLIAFVSLSIMNIWGCCNLGGAPLLGGWFSTGLIRGMCGLSFGIEAYYLSISVGKKLDKFRDEAITFFSVVIEALFILLVFYLAVKQKFNNKEFLMFFVTSALLVVLNLNRQKLFNCLNHSFCGHLGKISSMIYVTHYYLVKGFGKISVIKDLPDVAVYSVCVISACIVGALAFLIEKKIEKLLKAFVIKKD